MIGAVSDVVLAIDHDRVVRALTDVARAGASLLVAVRVWHVFPFDWGVDGGGWEVLARVLVVLVAVGSAFGVLGGTIATVRALIGVPPDDGPRTGQLQVGPVVLDRSGDDRLVTAGRAEHTGPPAERDADRSRDTSV